MPIEPRERYINPYTDFGFKKLFGTEMNKDLLTRLFNQAEIAQLSDAERHQYEESRKDFWDYYSTMKTSHDKGVAEGLEKGRAEGLKKGLEKGREEGIEKNKRENALKMKELGLASNVISQVTGLSVADIEELLT